VQTRLDEFLTVPHKSGRGRRCYYLKPLCVESGDELIMTTREDLDGPRSAKSRRKFAVEYRPAKALYRRPYQAVVAAANLGLAQFRAG